jgi:O-antigen/teichoic acid export membrane protein
MKSIVQVFSFDIASKVLLGVLGILLIRFMPEAEYARYTFAAALVAFASQTITGTFNRIYIVGYERLKLRGAAPAFLVLQLLAITLVVLLALPFRGRLAGAYGLAVAVVFAICLSEYSKTVSQQALQFRRFSLIEVARSALFLGAVLALVARDGQGIRAEQVLLLQAASMALVFLAASGRRSLFAGGMPLREFLRVASGILRQGYRYLFGYFALMALLSQMDVFMLQGISTEREVAVYGAGFRFYLLLSLALAAVHAVLLPVLQRVETTEEQDEILARHFGMVRLFAPAVALGAVAAGWVIPWVDGGKYPAAVVVFRILAASAVISFAFSPYVNILMRFEDFRWLLGLVCAALLAHAGLSMALLPRYGAVGAATVTLLVFGTLNASIFVRVRRRSGRWWREAAGRATGGATMPAAAGA